VAICGVNAALPACPAPLQGRNTARKKRLLKLAASAFVKFSPPPERMFVVMDTQFVGERKFVEAWIT